MDTTVIYHTMTVLYVVYCILLLLMYVLQLLSIMWSGSL
jgi:hypothetical protein